MSLLFYKAFTESYVLHYILPRKNGVFLLKQFSYAISSYLCRILHL